jgi:hypothetical protein
MGTSSAGDQRNHRTQFSPLADYCSYFRGVLNSAQADRNEKAIHATLFCSRLRSSLPGSNRLLPTLFSRSRPTGRKAGDSGQSGPSVSRPGPQSANPWNRQGGSRGYAKRKGEVHASDWRQSSVGKSRGRCHREMEMGAGCAGNQRTRRTQLSSLATAGSSPHARGTLRCVRLSAPEGPLP